MSNLNPGGLTRVLNYLKTWVTNLLSGKANSSHTHTWNDIDSKPSFANVATSGSYNDLSNKPTIPTNTSQLTNDMNFLHPGSGIKVVRGTSISTSGSGYWAAMCHSADNGSPTLPTTNAWWHVLSMDWEGSSTDVTNWCSQLALPTQDDSCLYWRRNDAYDTSINNSTWHKVIDDTNIGSQSVNYANSAGSSGSATIAAKLVGNDTRNNNYTPANYMTSGQRATIRTEFKQRNTLGAPGGSTYGTSVTITPWHDNSGGRSVQLYFSDSEYTAAIRFATGDSSWSSWYRLNTEYLTHLNGYRIYVG